MELTNLPNELLLKITKNLDDPSLTCLALTSNRFYKVLLTANNIILLRDLRSSRGRSGWSENEHISFMRSLASWMPDEFRLCRCLRTYTKMDSRFPFYDKDGVNDTDFGFYADWPFHHPRCCKCIARTVGPDPPGQIWAEKHPHAARRWNALLTNQ